MLNLLDHLSELDNKRITNYITTYGFDEYIGNSTYLEEWADKNKKLFHLLGGNLIYKVPIVYEKNEIELLDDLKRLVFSSLEGGIFFTALENLSNEDANFYTVNCIKSNIATNVPLSKDIPLNNGKVIKAGTKIMRALKQYVDTRTYPSEEKKESITQMFEAFRIKHSMVLNNAKFSGKLCLSIHPLDFITMSDNDSDWNSCMSWTRNGCYHTGTVEMMNSNCVICAYLESKRPYNFSPKKEVSEEWTWNNKKWRQLFYCTKEILVGGKAYPYQSQFLTDEVLKVLIELAGTNWNKGYEFGIETYKDMNSVNGIDSLHLAKINSHNNILFTTNGMYNDMLNDSKIQYRCVRNKVKKGGICISYSGKVKCLCCNGYVLDEDYDADPYDEKDEYNYRFTNVNKPVCSSCREDRKCFDCGEIVSRKEDIIEVPEFDEGYLVCRACARNILFYCPDCGERFVVDGDYHGNTYAKLTDEPLWTDDFYTNKMRKIYCCNECRDKFIEEGILEEEVIKNRRHPENDLYSSKVIITKEKVDRESDFVVRHLRENLKIFDF